MGLRTECVGHTFFETGLWFNFKGNHVTVLAGGRVLGTVHVMLPVSFNDEQQLVVCDKGDKIELFVKSEAEFIRLVSVTIDGAAATVFNSAGNRVGSFACPGLAPEGHAAFMGYFTESTVGDVRVVQEDASPAVFETKEVKVPEAISTVHYQPPFPGYVFDTIPFFDPVEKCLHVFFLENEGWSHVKTKDMVHYEKLAPALSMGEPDAPDCSCWTGSVFYQDGTYYLYYTGKNLADPKGDQKVMIAVSNDLVNFTKLPEYTFYADGGIYWNKRKNGSLDKTMYLDAVHAADEAFRDPHVFYDPEEKVFKMLLHARLAADSRHCFGVYASCDLLKWTPRQPLKLENQRLHNCNLDCPNMFYLSGKWFLVFSDGRFLTSDSPSGMFMGEGVFINHDCAVPKGTIDDKGRVLTTGTIRGHYGFRDNAPRCCIEADGACSMAREFYTTSTGKLCTRPVEEIERFYENQTVLQKEENLALSQPVTIASPKNYRASMVLELKPGAAFTFGFRKEAEKNGYQIVIDAKKDDVYFQNDFGTTSDYHWNREIHIDTQKPVRLDVYVDGTNVEFFVDDVVSLESKIYNYESGNIVLSAKGGAVVKQFVLYEKGE